MRSTGKLTVILERSLKDVCKFVLLYALWNLGFTMALYTMQHGTLMMTNTPRESQTA